MALIHFDDNFLAEVGLGALPHEWRGTFLQHVYNSLELRVGELLSQGMSDAQLAEFEAIIDGREDVVMDWLAQNSPDFKQDELFLRLQSGTGGYDQRTLQTDYAATKWLEVNRSDYREVVTSVVAGIRAEIELHRDAILAAVDDDLATVQNYSI